MKKKKTFSTLCSLLLTLSLTPIAAAAQPITRQVERTADDFKPVLRFAVISDLHISKDRSHHVFSSTFPKTMKTLYEISSSNAHHKTLDAVVFSGDLVDFGITECYDLLKEALDKNIKKSETQILACMGNHETMESFANGVTFLPKDTSIANFKNALGLDSIDTHAVINGYHFILSSLTGVNGAFELNRNREWTDEQLKIAAADGANKPIFTFNHFPIADTVIASSSEYNGSYLKGPRSEDLYKDYPQIVNFTGHSHTPLSYPNVILQQDFTNVSAGCLDRTDLEGYWDITNGYSSLVSHNLIVEVDAENTVRIYPYDFKNSCYLTENPIEIKNPSDKNGFVYTKECFEKNYSQPVFAEGAKIDAEIFETSIDFSFPQAVLNDTLYDYQCTIKRGGKVEKSWKLNSFAYLQYLKNDAVPTHFSSTAGGLKKNTEYTLEVQPIDCFNQLSESVLSLTFKTANTGRTPWSNPNIKINVYGSFDDCADKVLNSDDYVSKDNGVECTFRGGQLVVTKNQSGTWSTVVLKHGTAVPDTTGATGLGFYVENNLSNSIYICGKIFGNDIDMQTAQGLPFIRVDAETLEEVPDTVGIYGTISLPAGFKGYILIPFSSIGEPPLEAGKYVAGENRYANITNVAFKFTTSDNKNLSLDGENLVFDNFFVYGKEIEYSNESAVGIDLQRAAWAVESALEAGSELTKENIAHVEELAADAQAKINALKSGQLPQEQLKGFQDLLQRIKDFRAQADKPDQPQETDDPLAKPSSVSPIIWGAALCLLVVLTLGTVMLVKKKSGKEAKK